MPKLERILNDATNTEELMAARDVPEIHAACRRLANELGFEHFLYAVRIPVSLSQPYHFSLNGYPRAWRERYDAMGYIKMDPVVIHAFSTAIPLIWDEVDMTSSIVQAFFAEAAEYGLANGVTAPVYGRRGDLGLLSLARRLPISGDLRDRNDLKTRAHWFATIVHETIRRVLLTSDGNPIAQTNLSEREKDCLMWAADGKTSCEIAKRLEISERTVLFHLENAGRKLGVHGRHNTITRAIALGEVELSLRALRTVKEIPVTHESTNFRMLDADDQRSASGSSQFFDRQRH